MNNIKQALIEYKRTTEEIVIVLQNDNFDSLNGLIDKRGEIIQYINTMKYNQSEFSKICEEIQLTVLEEKINMLLMRKRVELRSNLDMILKGRNANKSYVKKYNVDSIFLSKKV